MKVMKNVFGFLALLGLLVSCGPSKQDLKIDAMYKQLLEGHDEVMPLSMQLPKLKAKVLESVSGLEDSDSLKTVAADIGRSLTSANDNMYTWMDDFGKAMNDVDDKTEKIKLYEGLKEEIKEIDTATKSSMEMAKGFIAEHE